MTELTQERQQISEKGALGRAALVEGTTYAGSKRLQEIRAEVGPRSGLEAYKSVKPIDETAGMQSVERIGFERDPATGEKIRRGEEARRYQEAGVQARLIELYLKEGFDRIADPLDKQAIVDNFKRALSLWSETSGLGPTDIDAYISKRLKDAEFIGRVKDVYEGKLKESELFSNSVVEAEDKYREAERAQAVADKKLTANRSEQRDIGDKIARFETRDARGRATGRLRELENLRANASANEAKQSRAQAEIDRLNREILSKTTLRDSPRLLNAAGTDYATVDGQISELHSQLENARTDLNNASADLGKLEAWEKELEDLKANKTKLEHDEVELQSEFDKAVYELTKNRAIFEDAKNTRAHQEEKFVADLKNVFLNAALNDVEATIGEWEDLRGKRLQDLEVKIGDRMGEVLKQIDRRWTEMKPNSTKPKDIKIRKDAVEADYLVLMQQGPREVARRALADAKDESGNRLFSDAEIENKLAEEAFMTKFQPEMVAQLLFRRMNNKRPSETEISIIATSQWGEGMIQAAAVKDKRVADALALVGNKYGSTTGEKLRGLAKNIATDKKTYSILAALLGLAIGTPFLIAGGEVVGALYEKSAEAALGGAAGVVGGS